MMKKIKLIWMVFVGLGVLNGCSVKEDDEDTLQVLFFTELSFELQENINAYFERVTTDEEMSAEVQMFLPSPEKLTVEMVAGEGDIYIVDKTMYPIIFDPVILHPLDSIVDDIKHNNTDLDRFVETDEDTGEAHLYAIPIEEDAAFFQDIQVNTSSSLIAVMMKDRPTTQFGLDILTELNR